MIEWLEVSTAYIKLKTHVIHSNHVDTVTGSLIAIHHATYHNIRQSTHEHVYAFIILFIVTAMPVRYESISDMYMIYGLRICICRLSDIDSIGP